MSRYSSKKPSTFGSCRWCPRCVLAIYRELFRERLEIDTKWCRARACSDRSHSPCARRQLCRSAEPSAARAAAHCSLLLHSDRKIRRGALAAATLHAVQTSSDLGSRRGHSGTHTRTETECVKRTQRESRLSRAGGESVGERLRAERGLPPAPAPPPRRPLPPMNDNNGRRSTRPQTE